MKYSEPIRTLRELGYLESDEQGVNIAEEYEQLRQSLTCKIDNLGAQVSYVGRLDDVSGFFCYAHVRTSKPDLFIETGIASGYSSAMILSAMEKNSFGRLISIDYPAYAETLRQIRFDLANYSWGINTLSIKKILRYFWRRTVHIPKSLDSGWGVPENLRCRWVLYQGESQKILSALDRLRPDTFLHDSLHSYFNMQAEFEWAWPKLRPGGMLISDDTSLNAAWEDFVAKHQPARNFVLAPNLGIAVKSSAGDS